MGPIKPGDRFFSVHSGRRPRERHVIVTKVGRRWADYTVEGFEHVEHWNGRFDMETFEIDGVPSFSSPGRVYRSEDEYRSGLRLAALWKEFRQRIDRMYQMPEGLTEIGILKAADALGFKLEEE